MKGNAINYRLSRMSSIQSRRAFLQQSAFTALALSTQVIKADSPPPLRLKLALKYNMANFGLNMEKSFTLLKEMGFDGVELDSPGGQNKIEALAASRATGLPIHGVVDSIHWQTRLSDPDEAVREKALAGLLLAIRESHAVGGTSVLLVPGVADEKTTAEQVWQRSIPLIRKALPLAEELKIHILIENVWNQFLYDPKGGNAQDAKLLCDYIDEINSPLVGSYFDIGNHQKFAKPAEWIRQLGKRIVKMDIKDWGVKNGFCKIGEGDIAWPDVRAAIADIKFSGWVTAEVQGGNPDVCKDIIARMRKYLLDQ
jgi:L-ribulose-5-phosphate 3-epimerase